MRHLRSTVAASLLLAALPGCEASTCIPTRTVADDAAVVNLDDPAGSSVLSAALTAEEAALAARTLDFTVRYVDPVSRSERESLLGRGTTDDAGRASFDAKEHPSLAFLRGVTEAEFRAQFTGDPEYCSSMDRAPLAVVELP